MSLNHHVLAKTTTDAVLLRFKTAQWSYGDGNGSAFYRVGTSAEFPSPDAAFYDPDNRIIASFEFKPPTETKRGILTGVGQSIAYLQSSNISFLVAPHRLENYDLGNYLTDLYQSQIAGKVPCGLILYENNTPENVSMAQGVEIIAPNAVRHTPTVDRFWAKHQDLPIPLLHLILHYYYLAKSNRENNEDPFAACFSKEFITETVLNDFLPKPVILDLSGNPIRTVAGTRNIVHLEKKLSKARELAQTDREAAYNLVARAIDTSFVGDNYYNSIRKNYLSFMKHLHLIDSENTLTDIGFIFYHLGLVNGPTSKVFIDYFIREVLTTGHHLDLILDIDSLRQSYGGLSMEEILSQMEADYEEKGFIKRNPNRQTAANSNVGFLKYERILWNALGLVDNSGTVQWKNITEICSLPDLI